MFPMSDRNNGSSGDGYAGAQPSMVTIALDRESQRFLKLWLPAANIREIADYPEDDSFLEQLDALSLDVCLVDFDRDSSRAFVIAERLHQANPDTIIFAVSSDPRPDVIIQAMRSGCREYLFKPLARDQLMEAVSRAAGRRRERKERPNSQVMTFIGAKGGCGVTTLATQLGVLLAGITSKKALLLDLHPSLGDAALYLGFTSSKYHSYELMENADRLDAELLQSLVLHHSSGLDVLPAPNEFDAARHLTSGALSHVFSFLRSAYNFILVDMPAGLNELTAKLMGHSDQLFVITVAEVSALRNCGRIVDYIAQEEVPGERVRVVLNRFEKRGPIPETQIEKLIQRKIFWAVPNQYHQALKTITSGDSAANISRSELIRNLKGWAEAVAGAKAEAEVKTVKRKRSGILGLFGEDD
jgi:pilus assembly protein CpaE